MGVAQEIEGKIENLVLDTAEPRAALGFHVIIISGQIFDLCCLTEYSNSRTELRSSVHFLNKKGWTFRIDIAFMMGPISRYRFQKALPLSPHLSMCHFRLHTSKGTMTYY